MGIGYVSKHAKHRKLKIAVRYLAIAAVVLLLVTAFVKPHILQVEMKTIRSAEISAEVGQLRIVYLSDIHYGNLPYASMKDVEALVTRINELRPDIVLLGGDYASDPDAAAAFFQAMPTIRATYGVYAVLGEHDRGDDAQLNALLAVLRLRDIKPLVNEAVRVRVNSQDIIIAGLDDRTHGLPMISDVAANCKQTDYVILMCHDPALISEILNTNNGQGKRNWFDLGLFGHTHGGQMTVGGGVFGAPVIQTAYRSGWYAPNKTTILVSNGVGTTGLPIRMAAAPQIHVITLEYGK